MKLFNLKTVLMMFGFLWIALSFFWFTQKQTQDSLVLSAEKNLEFAKLEFLQKSNDLKFKLGQWGYNYNLVKTKGLDFDHESFANSDFESIYFFSIQNNEFKPQWSKSKDLAVATIPRSIKSKLKTWTKEKLAAQNFIFFSDDPSPKGSKIFFGFYVADTLMGEGLLLSSLDLSYVQLVTGGLNTYLVDHQGRFLFHPKREYIGQSASKWLRTENSDNTITKSIPAEFIGGEFIFKQKSPILLSQVLMPTLVMYLGLMLVFAVLIFDIYLSSPLKLAGSTVDLDIDRNNGLKVAQLEDESFKSITKLNSIRESLNKMSLLSSALKGRLDLATIEKADATLIYDIKKDFEDLDRMLDETYKSILNDSLKNDGSLKDVVKGKVISSTILDNTNGTASKSTSGFSPNEDNKNIHALGQEIQNSLNDFNDNEEFNFDIALEEFDLEDTLDSEDLTEGDLDDELSDGLSLKDLDLSSGNGKGVVFQEYVGADMSADSESNLGSNDWAKIIEELTDEINNAPLKPTQDESSRGV